MELRQLRYFQAVASEGHFRAAAARLNVAQPALSYQVAQLERELGVKLFDRTSRSVQLTSAGELLLERTKRILSEVTGAGEEMAEFRGLVRGDLRLAVLPTLGVEAFPLARLLAEFNCLHPLTRTAIREGPSPAVFQWLADGEVQVAFLMLPPSGVLPAGLSSLPFLVAEVVILVARQHELAVRPRVTFRELERERFVVFRPGAVSRQLLVQASRSCGFEPEVAFEVGDAQMLRALVAEGMGVSLVPDWCYKAHNPPLACVGLDEPRLHVTVAMAWSERFYQAPAVTAFIKLARERLVNAASSSRNTHSAAASAR